MNVKLLACIGVGIYISETDSDSNILMIRFVVIRHHHTCECGYSNLCLHHLLCTCVWENSYT